MVHHNKKGFYKFEPPLKFSTLRMRRLFNLNSVFSLKTMLNKHELTVLQNKTSP